MQIIDGFCGSENTTCSLTEARMLFAVFSASILRPVEASRMVNRSPSSVTGLCSGAGIPPVWTHTIITIIPPGKNSPFLTPERVMSGDYRNSRAAITSKTHSHGQYGQEEHGRQCFMVVTVQLAAIWSWDDLNDVCVMNSVGQKTAVTEIECICIGGKTWRTFLRAALNFERDKRILVSVVVSGFPLGI